MLTLDGAGVEGAKPLPCCRIVVRNDSSLMQVAQFVVEGLQIGQQVVAMAGARFLRELAQDLNQGGLRPDAMLRNGRLVFLTAPGCLSMLLNPDDPLQRGPLRPNAPLVRWVSDWTWAYRRTAEPMAMSENQRRTHEFVKSMHALSLCSVSSQQLDRNAMLALIADHRRAVRGNERMTKAAPAMLAAGGRH
ncbi:MAG: hypothetical protein ACRD1J_05380 [Terriglobia bacterium]